MRGAPSLALFLAAAGCSTANDARAPLLAPAAASPVRVGKGPGDVALVDVDRDGHPDLLTRHLAQRDVTLLLGDGRGGFAAPSTIPLALEPGAMAVGDVNGDGFPDLVVTTRDAAHEALDVLLGARSGAFARAPGAPFATAARTPRYKPGIVLADLDGDGRLDAVTSNGQTHAVEISLGDGAGRFRLAGALNLGTAAGFASVALGDVDGDGRLDLVSATNDGVAIRRGDGRGAFREPAGPPLSAAPEPKVEAVADVDGDGRADIVLSHAHVSLLTVLLDGGGAFVTASGSPFDLGRPVSAVIAADADRDGHTDLIVLATASSAPFVSEIAVLLGPRFLPAPGSPFAAGNGAYHLAAADVNADGRLDVAASDWESDGVVLLLGRP